MEERRESDLLFNYSPASHLSGLQTKQVLGKQSFTRLSNTPPVSAETETPRTENETAQNAAQKRLPSSSSRFLHHAEAQKTSCSQPRTLPALHGFFISINPGPRGCHETLLRYHYPPFQPQPSLKNQSQGENGHRILIAAPGRFSLRSMGSAARGKPHHATRDGSEEPSQRLVPRWRDPAAVRAFSCCIFTF